MTTAGRLSLGLPAFLKETRMGFSLFLLLAAPLPACEAGRALLAAAERGDVPALRELLAGGADPNFQMPNGDTALALAVAGDQLAAAKFLLESGADPNLALPYGPVLFLAVHNGNRAIAELLVRRGARIEPADPGGASALMLAAAAGDADITRLLLDAGRPSMPGRPTATPPWPWLFERARRRLWKCCSRGGQIQTPSPKADRCCSKPSGKGTGRSSRRCCAKAPDSSA